ncbi:hypothetical protein Pst134EA_000490 [Puccinia striiformis f. sp. tritici]|uniref:hypothetical protein n=1 Tax=Puccinia striiformis f. sp. tritici TaxID=168172 RepID=UPI0020071EBD|nr:hypothetical protein Pst134EA_000490 [Puccinia striiformis f. sp. tritici]KAH9473417.1 hypothetical protein Pst134EA_000490 [Puccinia striiformis f. sp. tritici]
MTMFASRALFSSVLCVIVAAVTAFRQAPDGPLNLCSGSGTNSMVVGALYSNGTVSRVSGRGQLLDTPSGHCSCVANGVYCPVHPSNPLFRGPLVFCANTKTNKCFSTVEYNVKPVYPPLNLCSGSGTSSMVVGALYSNGTVSRVSGQGQSLDTPSGHCSCVTNGVYCPVPPSNPLFRGPLVFCADAKTNKCFKTVAYNPGQNTPWSVSRFLSRDTTIQTPPSAEEDSRDTNVYAHINPTEPL